MEKILITGMAGGLANVVAARLAEQYQIIGVDFRPYRGEWPYSGECIKVDYTKRAFADIFHRHKPSKVLHLGRIGNPWEKFYKRYNLNVLGTSNILQLCSKHNVQTVLIFSTFHVYGAHLHNSSNIEEDHPLRAAQIFPELIDAIELDHLATSYLWENRDIRTVVLRPCNVVGPSINNTITRLLRNKYVPYLMGFDPMTQFIHEDDLARAIVLALENDNAFGVFNVVGAGAVPFKQAIKIAGAKGIPIPHPLAYTLANKGFKFPAHLIDYCRYPVILYDKKFRQTTGYVASVSLLDTLRQIR